MLAQEWLHGRNRVTCPYDHMLEHYLALPTKFNPHSSVAVLNKLAERIVFTDDVPSLLYELHDNKQLSMEGMIESAHLPYDCFWIEYSSLVGINEPGTPIDDIVRRAEFGALVLRVSDRVRMFIVAGMHYHDLRNPITAITHIIEFHHWPPRIEKMDGKSAISSQVLWSFKDKKVKRKDESTIHTFSSGSVSPIIIEIIFGIFLVTQPKVYTDEQVSWSDRHKHARARKNKPALLEYRKLRVHIGRQNKRYVSRPSNITYTPGESTDSDEAIQHRRYHKVMGHFRHYMNEKTKRTVWIEAHYRGDPKLGVTFTERDVSR